MQPNYDGSQRAASLLMVAFKRVVGGNVFFFPFSAKVVWTVCTTGAEKMKGKLMSVLVSGRMPENESCIHEYNYKHSSGVSCLRKGERKCGRLSGQMFSLLHSRGPVGFVSACSSGSWQLKG